MVGWWHWLRCSMVRKDGMVSCWLEEWNMKLDHGSMENIYAKRDLVSGFRGMFAG